MEAELREQARRTGAPARTVQRARGGEHDARSSAGQGATPSSGTVRFEGGAYGAGVSFFLVNSQPGEGPELHRHPYSETWIVRSGRARFTVDGQTVDAGPGDIVVVAAGAAHQFRDVGSGRLEIVCIHAADRMVTEWLTPASAGARHTNRPSDTHINRGS